MTAARPEPAWRQWAERPRPWGTPHYLYAHATTDELPLWIESARGALERCRRQIARARARGGFFRTPDGLARLHRQAIHLRQEITVFAAELRARRGGDRTVIRRCEWLRDVVLARKEITRLMRGAAADLVAVERCERALATGRRANGEAYPKTTLRKYRAELAWRREWRASRLTDLEQVLAAAPPPYFSTGGPRLRVIRGGKEGGA